MYEHFAGVPTYLHFMNYGSVKENINYLFIVNLHYKFCLWYLRSGCVASCFNLERKTRQWILVYK